MRMGDLIERCRNDLRDIAENLRWAHADGYNPTNATQSRDPRPIVDGAPVRVPPTGPLVLGDDLPRLDPDAVLAPRHDIGQGDHRSRTAYRRTVDHLRRAEGFLALACHLLNKPQPAITRPVALAPLERLELTISYADTRLLVIAAYYIENPKPATRYTTAGAREIDRAWHTLNHCFERGPIPVAQVVGELCAVCAIRPAAKGGGGRCNTCKAWRDRKGYERPPAMDSVHEARAAKQRRLRRGDGWGDESLSATGGRNK